MKYLYGLNFIHYIPLYWSITGLFLVNKGDKILVSLIIISLIIKTLFHFFSIEKISISSSKYLLIIFLTAIYASISYYSNGYSSSEIRVLIATTLYLSLSAPNAIKINTRSILLTLLLLSITSISIMYKILYIDNLGRASLPFNAIPYANILSIFAFLSFYISLQLNKSKYKIIAFTTLILFISCVILTDTRGVWLSIVFCVFVSLLLYTRKKTTHFNKNIFTFMIGIAIIVAMSFTHLEKRYNSTLHELSLLKSGQLNSSWGKRIQLWEIGLDIIFSQPKLTGLGQNKHLSIIEDKYKKGKVSKSIAHFDNRNFHNAYIDRTVKYGFIGLILFITLLFYPFYRGVKEENVKIKFPLITLPLFISVSALSYVPLSHPGTLFLYLFIMYYYIQASDNNTKKRASSNE